MSKKPLNFSPINNVILMYTYAPLTQAHPLLAQLIVTDELRSENVNASFTNTGSGSPKDSTTNVSDLTTICCDCTDRPDKLNRLQQQK